MSIDRKTLTIICLAIAVLSACAVATASDGSGAVGSAVYLDPVKGDDGNDGLSADAPVETLGKAKELAGDAPIIVSGTIEVGNNENLVIEDVTLQRAEGFDGRLVLVYMYGEVTIRNATIDGMGNEASYPLIHTQGGTINIEDGAVLQNNGYTAVMAVNNGHINMTGGEIRNNTSEDDGGAVYIRKAYADITGGSIHDNTTAKSGGAIAFNSGRLTVGDVEIYGNVSNGIHSTFSDESTSIIGGGAAIYAESNKQNDAILVVSGASIHDNKAAGLGGAMCIVDGHRYNDIEVTVSGVELYGNTAAHGDAVYVGATDCGYGYPSVTLAGTSSIGGAIALGYADGQSGPVLGIAEDYLGNSAVAVEFPDAVPDGTFAVYQGGEPDVSDFIVGGHKVQASGDGLVLGQEVTSVYLDPRNGNDGNDGLTAETPVLTLDRAKEIAGTAPVIVSGTIEVGNYETLVIEDVILQRAEGFTGYIVQVYMYGEVTIRNATIDGMGLEADKALVHTQGGTINIEDGTVLQNNGYTAVTVYNNGDLNMTGGEIRGNVSADDGGAVFSLKGDIAITGGSIHDNTTAKSGGAIAILSGEAVIGHVEIYENAAEGTHVGTSYAGRSSYYGGGAAIYAESNSQDDAEVTIDGAVIRDNTASGVGAAVLIYDGGQYNGIAATIANVIAEGNTADKAGSLLFIGKGQYSKDYPAVTLAGTNSLEGDIAVELAAATDGPVIGVGEGYGNSERIMVEFTGAVPTVQFVSYTGEPDAGDFMVDGRVVQVSGDGLVLGEEFDAIYLDPDNGSDENSGTSEDRAVETLDKARELAGDRPIVVCGEIEITKGMSPYTLDGATLQRAEGYTGKLLYVMLGAELTVTDTVIDGMGLPAEGALIHTQQGTVNIGAGAVLQNNMHTAVTVVNGGGELNMTGGKIVINSSDSDGGAIYVRAGSTANLRGGEISGNSTSASGGAVCVLGGTLVVDGTTITGNRSAGTSVDTILGTVSALPGGGAIYAETNSQGAASVTILSGIIEGNEAAADGGAILVYNSHRYNTATVLEIRGGSITDNAAEGDGDAVWVGYTEKAVRLPEFVVSGTPMVDGDIRMHGNGIVGVQIEVAVGFEPAGPLQVSFPQKPAYVIATGDVEADDFAVEGYALTAGSDGLLVGTYDDDGSIVTVETTVGKDGSGNTVTTTVTKVDGVKTEVSIEAEAETAEVDISDAIADLDGALLRVTVGDITVEVDGGSFGDGKNVSLSIAVDPEGLSDAQTAVAEDALKVIDVSAVGAQLSGDATISVGFTLSGDYDADTIRVLCVSEDGATEAMQSAYSDGVVTFTTDHLSVFMIEADPVSEPVGPEEPDTPVVPDFPDIPVIPGGGDDGGVITPPITIVGGDSEGGMTTTETVIVAALGVLAAFVVVLMAYSLRKS